MFSQEIINTFWNAFVITGKGMTGIFVFMGIFYLVIRALDKLFPQEAEQDPKN